HYRPGADGRWRHGDVMDWFALLNEPRRPWLDDELLKKKFLDLSAQFHPDRVHNNPEAERVAAHQCYTELNAAYSILREPKTRLRHLLELELGEKPKEVHGISSDLMEMFQEISRLSREADAFLAEKAKTTSALLQVQLFERSQQ